VMYVAGDGGNDSLDDYARPGDSTFFGGTYPALTWADYMATATKGQSVKQFDPPAYVNREKAPRTTATTRPERTEEPTEKATSEPTPTKTSKPSPTPTPSPKPTGRTTTASTTPKPTATETNGGGPGGGATPRGGG